jgi:hypothetical protein
MKQRYALALAAVAALAVGGLVDIARPTTADPANVAANIADAYAGTPGGARAASRALPAGARGLLAVTVVRPASGPGDERLTTVSGNPAAAQLASLATTGPIGVAVRDDVTAFVAVPSGGGNRVLPDVIAFVGVLLVAGAVALGRPASRPPVRPETAPGPSTAGRADAERAALVTALADLAPRLPPGLGEQAVAALGEVGVTTHRADGQAFDPDRHTAVGSLPAPTADQVKRVARTERPYFADRGRQVTRPLVVVYTDVADVATATPDGRP